MILLFYYKLFLPVFDIFKQHMSIFCLWQRSLFSGFTWKTGSSHEIDDICVTYSTRTNILWGEISKKNFADRCKTDGQQSIYIFHISEYQIK